MICPSCNQPATKYPQSAFSLKGVSFKESLQGYLTCRNCNARLKLINYSSLILVYLGIMLAVIVLFTVFFRQITSAIGTKTAERLFLPALILVGIIATYIEHKFARCEKVEEKSKP
jgi:preprotein translocase subunit SecY